MNLHAAHIGYDPYQLKKSDFSRDLSDLPAVEAMDITSYLVLHTSYYTASQMKAYKSLEAFNYFVCGWVNDLGTKKALNKCRLVFARVNHSQRSGETPLKTWIVAKEDGEVVTAHCNCMAGYGCKYEATARKQYEGVQSLHHQGFSCKDSGLWLNPQWPYMGASPDRCVTCTCHGTGICEIKCPHSKQEANLCLCAGEQGFCLVNDGGTVKLDRRHAYYHQVQAQLHVVDVDYCDLVDWTKNDLFVERIVRDVDLWDNIIPRVESFFRLCVLPEVLGQQLTRGKFQLQDDQEGEKA
ncbi:uncharacterized protein [Pseudochaenichthys georgianus]|uniref:uncharacterized protein isoform X2 n=1 Tax=Pseudochaenichthys georgianus TaxID=52239 RepID=UPI00146ADF1A|nr:uncharacterized protein LOC117440055 isoform X2 [Pseudochaenichthys georgianus]